MQAALGVLRRCMHARTNATHARIDDLDQCGGRPLPALQGERSAGETQAVSSLAFLPRMPPRSCDMITAREVRQGIRCQDVNLEPERASGPRAGDPSNCASTESARFLGRVSQ